MAKRILAILIIVLNIFSIISFADEEELEDFPFEEVWEEVKAANTKENINLPKLNSKAAIIFDRDSKTVIYGKNINEKRPMASTTKIMTAIVTLENGNLDEVVEVDSKAAAIHGSRLGLKKGDKIKIKDLLYGLLLRSGNDAATQIAISIGGSIEEFANMMNKKAKELGLVSTNFVTPHGLDNTNHYTTAYELALITDYALNIEEFANIVNTKSTTVYINSKPILINNTNELLGNLNGVNGVKTGFTNMAGRCLVTSCTRNNWPIITVVLGADTKKFRTKDSINLIEYNYKNFVRINIKEKVEEAFKNWKEDNKVNIEVIKGKKDKSDIDLEYVSDFKLYPINKEKIDDIIIQIECKEKIDAPVQEKNEIGKIHVIYENKEIIQIPIITKEGIERKNIWDYFKYLIQNQGRIIVANMHF
ncbi:MAG: D-alanyl-D-alanine carboxypeptidase [Clostridia bacterium]|nr:D-alanyl-D-alanine carboxypeptidase [Clostridia bacterium]